MGWSRQSRVLSVSLHRFIHLSQRKVERATRLDEAGVVSGRERGAFFVFIRQVKVTRARKDSGTACSKSPEPVVNPGESH